MQEMDTVKWYVLFTSHRSIDLTQIFCIILELSVQLKPQLFCGKRDLDLFVNQIKNVGLQISRKNYRRHFTAN